MSDEAIDRDISMDVDGTTLEGFEVKADGKQTTVLMTDGELKVRHIHEFDIRAAEILHGIPGTPEARSLIRAVLHLNVGVNKPKGENCDAQGMIIMVEPSEIMEIAVTCLRTLCGDNLEAAKEEFFPLVQKFLEEYADQDLIEKMESDDWENHGG